MKKIIAWIGLSIIALTWLLFAAAGAFAQGSQVAPFNTPNATIAKFFSGNIDGEIYPAQCSSTTPPSWCSGTTPDAWYRAACTQLPSTGGVINLRGLTGNIVASMTCSTPTKQVITLTDPTSVLNISESDGGIVFPLDEYSMLLGPGGGQCLPTAGFLLTSSANITAVVGPAHVDGTQESFTASGLCMLGKTGATVTKGLIYANQVFTNTTINQNNLFACNNACVWLQDVGGEVVVQGNWFNVGAGVSTINGSDLVILGTVGGSSAVDVSGNTLEHANGGSSFPEIRIAGNGSGGGSSGIHIHHNYIERLPTSPYTPDVTAISITDCQGCSVDHVQGQGTSGGTNFISVSQTAAGRTQNVEIDNVLATAWTNIVNDSVTGLTLTAAQSFDQLAHYVIAAGFSDFPCSPLAATPGVPYTGQCWTSPADYRTNINAPSGAQQMAWLSDVAVLPHSVGPDAMSGQGNFGTGSGTFGTNFSGTGCLSGQGLTCTFTRSSATAPPGSTFSQEVQITANTDPNIGFNGIQYGPSVSFTGGQAYLVNFWAKGDGTFTGKPTFLLWNSSTPIFYCQNTSNIPFSTSWTLYSFTCVPPVSGSSSLALTATTPLSQTGAFWFGGFTFSPVTPLTVGSDLVATGPYSVGSALLYNASTNPLPTCNTAAKGQKFTVSDATTPTYLATYASGGAVVAPVICNGSNWVTY